MKMKGLFIFITAAVGLAVAGVALPNDGIKRKEAPFKQVVGSKKGASRYDLPKYIRDEHIDVLSLDLSKNGKNEDYLMYWDGADKMDEKGRLHLRKARQFGVDTVDDFDIGFRPNVEAFLFELPKRNVLVIHQFGLGPPGGDTYHAFSSMNGELYRVPFIDENMAIPIVFTEHYSLGNPAAIRFLENGAKIRTLVSTGKGMERRVTEYAWDGSSYRKQKSLTCNDPDCPDLDN